MNDQSDYAFARAAQTGDTAALEKLLERMRGPLFALAYAETRNYEDAQDAIANGLLRVCRQIHTLRKPEAARSWMFRIVQNEARRLRGRVATVLLVGDEESGASGTSGINEQNAVIFRADIERALRQLPREQARAVSLFYLHGLSIRTIAGQLSRPEGTIKYWLHQSRQTLSETLKDYAPMTKTTKTAEIIPPSAAPLKATIISTDIAPDLLTRMTDALIRAGWSDTQTRPDFADLGMRPPAEGEPARVPDPLWKSRLLVLDEWVNHRSVFEVLPILRGRADTKNTAIFLLINGDRSEKEKDVTVLSAYVSGVDMLLTKPFDLAEFESFARRLRANAEAA